MISRAGTPELPGGTAEFRLRPLIAWLLFLVAVSSSVSGCAERAEDPGSSIGKDAYRIDVAVAEVSRESVVASLELTGTLIPRDRSIIVSEVDAVIRAFPKSAASVDATPAQREYLRSIGFDLDAATLSLNIGDEVQKGEVLVELDTRDFELELAAARARLAKARADLEHLLAWKRPEELRRLKALQSEARAKLEQAKLDLERAESLREKDVLTPSELDRRRTEVRISEAALERATASLEIATAGPTRSEVAVARSLVDQAELDVEIAEERLRKTVIRAPYDCVVTDRFLGVGDQANTQQRVEIMEIMDLGVVLAQVGVPERFVGKVRLGDRVAVRAEGASSAVGGIVVLVNDKVEPQTRTFRVRVMLENRDHSFKAGQFARVTFKVAAARDALAAPSAALVYREGHAQVFLVRGERVELRPVTTGITDHRLTEILSGVSEGDVIVVDDPSVLAHGMSVRRRATTDTAETSG